jgi:Fe-S cluster assembly protein SufD
VLEARGQTRSPRPLAALNTAFATDGVLIRVTGKAARPVALIYHHKSEADAILHHHCIKLEAGAELTCWKTAPPPRAHQGDGGRGRRRRTASTTSARRAATMNAAPSRISSPGWGQGRCSSPSP